jgi:hypothetical protein
MQIRILGEIILETPTYRMENDVDGWKYLWTVFSCDGGRPFIDVWRLGFATGALEFYYTNHFICRLQRKDYILVSFPFIWGAEPLSQFTVSSQFRAASYRTGTEE